MDEMTDENEEREFANVHRYLTEGIIARITVQIFQGK